MSAMAPQITSLTIAYSTVYSNRRSKKTLKLHVTGICEGNSPTTGEFPSQRASNAENFSIWWRRHELFGRDWIEQMVSNYIKYMFAPRKENQFIGKKNIVEIWYSVLDMNFLKY